MCFKKVLVFFNILYIGRKEKYANTNPSNSCLNLSKVALDSSRLGYSSFEYSTLFKYQRERERESERERERERDRERERETEIENK